MTDAERNELVEKLRREIPCNASQHYISQRAVEIIESLGYEIVKKEKEFTPVVMTQQQAEAEFCRLFGILRPPEVLHGRPMTDQERKATAEFFWSIFNSPDSPPL